MGGTLWHALGICPGDRVLFTGGEGRLALLQAVERELARESGAGMAILQAGPAGHLRPDDLTGVDLLIPVLPPAVANLPHLPAPLGADTRVVPVLLAGAGAPPADALRPAARRLAIQKLGEHVAGRALVVNLAWPDPVLALEGDVSAILLAGGASRRFGGAKLLQPFGGRTVIEASLLAALRAGLREVLVVTGAYHPELAALLAPYPVRLVHNPDWAQGMSTSLKAGVRALQGEPAGVLLCLGDQPGLPALVVRALAQAHRSGRALLVAPAVRGERRSPVLFDRSLLPELLQIQGDEGGREVVRRHQAQLLLLPYENERWFHDVDRPHDLDSVQPT